MGSSSARSATRVSACQNTGIRGMFELGRRRFPLGWMVHQGDRKPVIAPAAQLADAARGHNPDTRQRANVLWNGTGQ